MSFQFIIHVDKKEHDAFVTKHPLCNLLQSSKWANIKSNWENVIVGVKENGALIASASVLIRTMPLGYTMFYIPRGPIMDYHNESIVHFFMNSLKKYAKKRKAIFITIDPAILRANFEYKQETIEYQNIQPIIHRLRSCKGIFKGFTTSLEDTIQPRFHANVYYTTNYTDNFSKAAKKAMQQAPQKHLYVKYDNGSSMKAFVNVMQCTEDRKQIQLRDENYYRKLMETYQEDACIVLCELHLKELYLEVEQKLQRVNDELIKCPPNAKKKRFTLEEQKASYERDYLDLQKQQKEYGERVVIAGALCIKYGKTSEILYAGMNDTFKRYMAPYLSFSSCMKWAFDQGCEWCNMGGVEGTLDGGLMKFKANFHPHINEFIGEFDFPIHPIKYRVFQLLYEYRKKKKSRS